MVPSCRGHREAQAMQTAGAQVWMLISSVGMAISSGSQRSRTVAGLGKISVCLSGHRYRAVLVESEKHCSLGGAPYARHVLVFLVVFESGMRCNRVVAASCVVAHKSRRF